MEIAVLNKMNEIFDIIKEKPIKDIWQILYMTSLFQNVAQIENAMKKAHPLIYNSAEYFKVNAKIMENHEHFRELIAAFVHLHADRIKSDLCSGYGYDNDFKIKAGEEFHLQQMQKIEMIFCIQKILNNKKAEEYDKEMYTD